MKQAAEGTEASGTKAPREDEDEDDTSEGTSEGTSEDEAEEDGAGAEETSEVGDTPEASGGDDSIESIVQDLKRERGQS